MLSVVTCVLLGVSAVVHAQTTTPLIKDFFAAMPDSLLPLMTQNDRLDCIDYIENHMQARIHNKFDEDVELETLTADYLRLRTSSSTYQEMKLFLLNDTTPLFCIIATTLQGDSLQRIEDSVVRFYDKNFQKLPTTKYLEMPSLESFLTIVPDTARQAVAKAMSAFQVYHPMHIQFAEAPLTFRFTPQIHVLATEDQKALAPYLRSQEKEYRGHLTQIR